MGEGVATRQRILETAWQLVGDRGLEVTLADVAVASAVSRQAVYLHFGSRSGLLVAMARHRDKAAGMVDRFARLEHVSPAEHLKGVVSAWLAHIPTLEPVAMALYAASLQGDADAGSAWRDRMDDLRGIFKRATARLADADLLADGWTTSSATDWIWTSTHLTQWHHLVRERGWSERRARAHLAASASVVLADQG